MRENYKAVVIISGAMTKPLYGTDYLKLKVKAHTELTKWKPGFASLTPQSFDMYKSLGRVTGNKSEWKLIETVYYKDIPEKDMEWKRRELERERFAALKPMPEPQPEQPKRITAAQEYSDIPVLRMARVAPKCDQTGGQWYCVTHKEWFSNQFEKDTHIHTGVHCLAWYCYAHQRMEAP